MARNITRYIHFIDNLLLFPIVTEFSKLVNSWWSYRKKFDTAFFSETQCMYVVVVITSANEVMLTRHLSVCLSVYFFLIFLSANSRKNYWFDLRENFTGDILITVCKVCSSVSLVVCVTSVSAVITETTSWLR